MSAAELEPIGAPYYVTDLAASSDVCDYCEEGAEFGEHHHELYESRDGAASHTADELAWIFCDAVQHYTQGAYRMPRPDELAEPKGWCDDPDDSQAWSDECQVAEGALSAAGFSVWWNDGYVIEKVLEP